MIEAGKQEARDFDYKVVKRGREEIRGVPELLAYERNGVGKGGMRFAVPSGLANGEFSGTRQTMGQQSNDRKQAEQHGCRPGNRQMGPLALRLYSKVKPYFLEGDLHLPAPKEPLQDLTGILIELGAEQSAGFELAFGVSDQHPTEGHWGQTSVVPNRGAGSDFYETLRFAIPISNFQRLPDRVATSQDLLE
jgi:hypothetical protein